MLRVCILLLFYIILLKLSLEDLKEKKICDKYVWMITGLAVMAAAAIPEIGVWDRLLGVFAISVPMTILALIFPGSFGGGDIKLAASCGAFLGTELILKGTVCGIFIGALWSLWILFFVKQKKNHQFPFGPCLSAGFLLASLQLFLKI